MGHWFVLHVQFPNWNATLPLLNLPKIIQKWFVNGESFSAILFKIKGSSFLCYETLSVLPSNYLIANLKCQYLLTIIIFLDKRALDIQFYTGHNCVCEWHFFTKYWRSLRHLNVRVTSVFDLICVIVIVLKYYNYTCTNRYYFISTFWKISAPL